MSGIWEREVVRDLERHWEVTMHQRKSLLKTLEEEHKELFKGGESLRILDAGCGIGVMKPFLEEMGYEYYGVDASPAMVERAKELHPDININTMDLAHIVPTHGQYHVVLLCDVLIHDIRFREILNKVWPLVKNGGALIIKNAYIRLSETRIEKAVNDYYNITFNPGEFMLELYSLIPSPHQVEPVDVDENEKCATDHGLTQIFIARKGEKTYGD